MKRRATKKRVSLKKTRNNSSKKTTGRRTIKQTAHRKSVVRLKKTPVLEKTYQPLEAIAQTAKEHVEVSKFTPTKVSYEPPKYHLPFRYHDNRIVLLARDPWWVHTYWDISEVKINEVLMPVAEDEKKDLRWILRVYDVTQVKDFNGHNAHSSFDIDINFEANNWYINVNSPERAFCVDIGLRNPQGRLFVIARSNIIKTPCFGISDMIDEEWMIPDDDFFRVLGIYDLGRSSLERKRKFEEILKHQISSPLASWGVSSLFLRKSCCQR